MSVLERNFAFRFLLAMSYAVHDRTWRIVPDNVLRLLDILDFEAVK